MSIAYKPEIDGLRAIAVSAVVLYHAGLGGAGFVGVDIFFVISGYLITSLLLKEQASTGRLGLLDFYARRARRILPAVLLVVAVTIGASSILLPPEQFSQATHSAAASMLFLANVFFQGVTGGYFDADATEMPLLHLWSLSVEEQFYLFWPALLLLVLRFRPKHLGWILVALGIASFASAQFLVGRDPEMAFYQMPARFWELAAGGLVAVLPVRILPRGLLVAGLVLILGSCLHPFAVFPAIGALPVVLGSTMVIAALHGGTRNTWLASRPLVGVGLVSYSFYLWHWPIFALYRATVIGPASTTVLLQLGIVAFLLAVATYRYVENPVRRNRAPSGRTVLVSVAVLAGLSIGLYRLSIQSVLSDPYPLATKARGDMPAKTCHSSEIDSAALKCHRKPGARWGIWGDSMAYAWTPAVWTVDNSAAVFTRDACGPYLGFVPHDDFKRDQVCRKHNRLVAQSVRGLDRLVIVALWLPEEDRFAALSRALDAVAPQVGQVLVLGPTPTMRDDVPQCLRSPNPLQCAESRSDFDRHNTAVMTRLNQIAARYPNVRVVNMSPYFCGAQSCPPVLDGIPLYWDTHHITMSKVRQVNLQALAPP